MPTGKQMVPFGWLAAALAVVAGCSPSESATSSGESVEAMTPAAVEEPASQGVAIGDAAPEFHGLQGVDDQTHSLADYADAKLLAIVFTCNHCPVAVAYEDRLVELVNDYEERGVQFVAINVNNLETDRLPKMKERAEAKGFNFPYLYDPSQEIGHAYGATVTPHVFVLDNERRVAYMGAIDDSQNPANVTESYLRDALDALLAGDTPEPAATQQFGCSIVYE